MDKFKAYFHGRSKKDYFNADNFNDLVDVLGDYKPAFKCKLCDNPEEFFDHLYRHSVNHSGVEQQ